MKLSKDQIQQIETYLTQKSLKYIDIRYEALDHIASDIEQMMGSRGLSFKDASEIVFLKWSKNFVTRSNFFIGSHYSGPKIFIDNCFSIYKKLIFQIQFISFVFIIGLSYLLKYFNITGIYYNANFILALRTSFALGMIILLYWFIQIKRKKLQTSYSFLYLKKIFPFVMILLTLGIFSESISGFLKLPMIVLIYGLWSGWILYKNHIKTVSNYSLLAKS